MACCFVLFVTQFFVESSFPLQHVGIEFYYPVLLLVNRRELFSSLYYFPLLFAPAEFHSRRFSLWIIIYAVSSSLQVVCVSVVRTRRQPLRASFSRSRTVIFISSNTVLSSFRFIFVLLPQDLWLLSSNWIYREFLSPSETVSRVFT